jgi:Xaa-Pro dipeptidase
MTNHPGSYQVKSCEIEARLEKLRAKMTDTGIDQYVCFDPSNIYYLVNFSNVVHERPFLLVVSFDALHYVVPRLELPHVESQCVGPALLHEYSEFPAPAGHRWIDALKNVIRPNSRIGIESACPAYLSSALGSNTVCVNLVDTLREVKSPHEIDRIRYAGSLMVEALGKMLSVTRPGRSVAEVIGSAAASAVPRALAEVENFAFSATGVTGFIQTPNASHDPHNGYCINEKFGVGGPNVSLVFGRVNGYGAEVERTFFLDSVPEEARRPFDFMMDMRRSSYERLRPGAVGSEIDRACRDILRAGGYGEALHRCGHSFGVTSHEGPFLADGADNLIVPGNIFSIEPGVYIKGIGGFRHSDTVLVTPDGCENLTPFPDTLSELIFGT